MTTANDNDKTPPARAIGSVTIAFGLVNIPCKVFSTAESTEEIKFNLLTKDGSRVEQVYKNKTTGEIVPRDELVKGYEHAKGQFVTFTQDELDALDAVSSNRIEVDSYVDIDEIEPIYVEKSYYLGPDHGHDKAYSLFAAALGNLAKMAIGRWSTRGRENLVCVVPFGQGMAIHQLRYEREVKPWAAVPPIADVHLTRAELEMAEQLITRCEAPMIDMSKYEDRVHQRKLELIEAKVAGGEITASQAEAVPPTNVIDIVEVLKASLDQAPKKAVTAPAAKKPTPITKNDRKKKIAKVAKKKSRAA